eukprot:TRINITY_DN2235_c0_g1_i2.p1 TRINITY_DN2235_c0_g1~~TRINITY_DN2235_c0_g1_i2.p1  ORF type:complete len:534 (+),score=66.86 TRINITY_DN2235_c0_g1_i2:82-1683(+)
MSSRRVPSPASRAGVSRNAGSRDAHAHAGGSAGAGDDTAGIPAAAHWRQQASADAGVEFEVCAWLRHHADEATKYILAQGRAGAPLLTQLGEAVCDIWSNHVRGALLDLTLARKFAEEPLTGSGPVIMVVCVVGTIWVSWIFIPPSAAASWPATVCFNSALALSMWSYHEAVTTFPGGIPDDWGGDANFLPRFALRHGVQARTFALERKANGALRYCQKELKFKPDRAHYCRIMSCNVLRMDHYCPFICNCVGYLNHKHFMLFLFYTVVGTNISAAELLWALVASGPHSAMCTFMLTQGVFVSSLFAGLITPFFGFHCWLVARNFTTIEYSEKRRRVDVPREYYSPYDRGVYENFISVMGDVWHYWPFPVGKPPGDGLQWRRGCDDIVDDTDTGAQAEPGEGEARAANPDGRPPAEASSSSQRLAPAAEARSSRNDFFQNVVLAVEEIGSDVAATGRELATGVTSGSLTELCQRSAEGYWQSFETQREHWELLWRRATSAPEISTTVRGPPPLAMRTLGRAVSGVRWVCPSAL